MKLHISVTLILLVLFLGIYPTEAYGLYDRIPHIDKVLHLAGSFVVALFLTQWLHREARALPPASFALLIVGSTVLIGVFWEFAEYLSGAYLRDAWPLFYRYFHGGDLKDTLLDLAMDMGGAFALVSFWLRFVKNGK